MTESFGIGSFRSRQQVMRFEAALRRKGIRCTVISTPRDVAVGCGLSVRFEVADMQRVIAEYRATRPTNLIGFYIVERANGRTALKPITIEQGANDPNFGRGYY